MAVTHADDVQAVVNPPITLLRPRIIGHSTAPCFVDWTDLATGEARGGLAASERPVYEKHEMGETFRQARQDAGLSLREGAARLGVSLVDMSSLERGEMIVSDSDIKRVVELLKAPKAKPTKAFWVRWYAVPEASFETTTPWWVSGEAGDGSYLIFVAAVRATDADAAKDVIRSAYAGEVIIEWSFVNERPSDWAPFGDRFPRADWMVWP